MVQVIKTFKPFKRDSSGLNLELLERLKPLSFEVFPLERFDANSLEAYSEFLKPL
jgi:hypothetical protein